LASSGTIFLIPFYLQNVLKYDPQTSGLLLAVFPITLGMVGPLSGWLSDRFGFRILTVIGLGILAIGYFGLINLSVDTTWDSFIFALVPLGVGMGMFQSPNNSAILGTAPSHRLGVISGLLAITRTLGQTSGIAIISALWTNLVYKQTGVLTGGATTAPAFAQVAGLHSVFLVLGLVLCFAVLLSLYSWFREKQNTKFQASEAAIES
jgi:MFS family permease